MSTAQQTIATTQREKKRPFAPIPEWRDMSKEERAAWLRQNGKGFLSKVEREEQLRAFYDDIEYVYLAESDRARDADDEESFWAWFSLVKSPAHSLAVMKKWYGADFIRKWGFDTSTADKAYGPDWLEK